MSGPKDPTDPKSLCPAGGNHNILAEDVGGLAHYFCTKCDRSLSPPERAGERSMSEHTPGPWDHINTPDYAEIRHPNFGVIAMVKRQEDTRLIAAAPDLLEALRRVDSECDELANTEDVSVGDRRCYKALRNIARAAIAKATGKGSGA